MNKLLPQFQNVTLWQSFLLAAFSILLTWGGSIYAMNDFIQKYGNENSKSSNLVKIAAATFDVKIIVFGLGVYLLAGIACFILFSLLKRFRATPVVQYTWGLFIVFGIMAAYIFR